MSEPIKLIRGMHDILPSDMPAWQQLEEQWRELVESHGYRQIRTPLVERTALFKRSVGEATDIVEKEMYSFEDRGGESLSLRPEGTAGVVRAGIEHGLLVNQQQRWWYIGPMFRYERPQRGRYRQFHQLGAECFGMPGADIEAELIGLAARYWKRLGLEGIELQINTLGSAEVRRRYRDRLTEYLRDRFDELDEDSRRRLETNPLRILDSKNPGMQALIEAAPRLLDHLDDESAEHFGQLQSLLDAMGQPYVVNPRLVRGLDYYCHTVFEWVTDTLGAQGTVCAGGRYDGLVEQLGGRPAPAAGFAMGIERLVTMLQDQDRVKPVTDCEVYLLMVGEAAQRAGRSLAEQLRDAMPRLRLIVHAGGGSFKSQMKKADKSGARIALILGEDEAAAGQVSLKHLREDRPQQKLAQSELPERLAEAL